jgi:hypothetical protein
MDRIRSTAKKSWQEITLASEKIARRTKTLWATSVRAAGTKSEIEAGLASNDRTQPRVLDPRAGLATKTSGATREMNSGPGKILEQRHKKSNPLALAQADDRLSNQTADQNLEQKSKR